MHVLQKPLRCLTNLDSVCYVTVSLPHIGHLDKKRVIMRAPRVDSEKFYRRMSSSTYALDDVLTSSTRGGSGQANLKGEITAKFDMLHISDIEDIGSAGFDENAKQRREILSYVVCKL